MIADKAPELLEASKSMYEYNADTDMRQRCIARMEYLNDMLSEKIHHLEKILLDNGISVD